MGSFDSEGSDPYEVAGVCEVEKETDRALLVRLPGQKEVWIPKSVIHDDSEVFDDEGNRRGRLIVKKWFGDREGL